jgi:hypothetical protein
MAGWDEQRVRQVITEYERQSEEEAVAEDEAALRDENLAVVEIPRQLVPAAVRDLIAKYEPSRASSRGR